MSNNPLKEKKLIKALQKICEHIFLRSIILNRDDLLTLLKSEGIKIKLPKSIDGLIIEENGELILLTTQTPSVKSQNQDSNNTYSKGFKLREMEEVSVKIETLPLTINQQHARLTTIDRTAVLGKKSNVVQHNFNIYQDGKLKNIQISSIPKGKQLLSNKVKTPNTRFNPYQLREDQKIELAQQLIIKLHELHFTKNTLHGDLTADNIHVIPNGNSFNVEFVNFDMAQPLIAKAGQRFATDNSTSTVQEDIKAIIQVILQSVGLKNNAAIEALKQFAQRNTTTESQYFKLIEELDACKAVPNLGMDIFKEYDFPLATEQKNIFCILVQNVSDGIGDFMHAWELANKLKSTLHDQQYRIVALMEIFHDEPPQNALATTDAPPSTLTLTTRNRDLILKMLGNPHESPFDEVLYWDINKNKQADDNQSFDEWKSANTHTLDQILPSIAGAIEVSYPTTHMRKLLGNQVKPISCFQYGFINPSDPHAYPLTQANMGFPEALNPNCPGIKINTNPLPNSAENEQVLLALKEREPAFVNNLLLEKSPNEYFATHHFMPGYVQTKNAACAFITSHVLKYRGDNKTCDFLIPGNVVNEEAIYQLLEKSGINRSEVAFIKGNNHQESSQAKVRIFSYRINNDNDYESLFRLSNDGAAGSGDNSLSTVLSGPHLPFYQYKGYPIGNFYNQLLYLVETCIEESICINDNALEDSLRELHAYFKHLNRIKSRGERDPNKSGVGDPGDLPDMAPTEETKINEELSLIASERFFKYCQDTAEKLKNPRLAEIAWPYVAQKIRLQCNIFDSLDNIAKASVVLSTTKDTELSHLLAGSNEIKGLVLTGYMREDDAKSLPAHLLTTFSYPPLKALIHGRKLSIESLKILIGNLPEANKEQLTRVKINHVHKILNELPNTDEMVVLLNRSELLTISLCSDFISSDYITQNFKKLTESSQEQLALHLYQQGNISITLLNLTNSPGNDKIISFLLNSSPRNLSPDIQRLLKSNTIPNNYQIVMKDYLQTHRKSHFIHYKKSSHQNTLDNSPKQGNEPSSTNSTIKNKK